MATPMDEAPPAVGTGERRLGGENSMQTLGPAPSSNTNIQSAKPWDATLSQPPYIPQFSAATSRILSRIKGGSQSFSSALSDVSATMSTPDRIAYEDARSRLVQSMNTSIAAPAPSQPTPTHSPDGPVKEETPSTDALNQGTKRKREPEQEKVDFTQNTMAMPSLPTRLPPQSEPLAPQGSHTTGVNGDDAGGAPYYAQKDVDPRRQQKIERTRQKRLAALPEGVAPAKPELVGFGPGAASDYARTEYFYNMGKTDILNLLSFCDQLRPQLLVDLMVSVSKRHPDLPIFDSPVWDASIPQPSTSNPRHKPGPPGRSRHGRSLLNSKAKQRIKGNVTKPSAKKPLKRSRLAEETFAEEHPDAVDEDDMPPTWPKAGEGLYAKLEPETTNGAFLADDNDEEAFSQFMVDKLGRQIVDPV